MCLQLPDYHDIIEHPMDFGTVRKKLDQSEYANLEQFEVCTENYFKYPFLSFVFMK
jgi:Bromodomain